jgi:hypothetical protein
MKIKRKIIVLSMIVVSGHVLANGDIDKVVDGFDKVDKKNIKEPIIKKKLKHFHEPFCVCNKSPLFTEHKYDGRVHGFARIHHVFSGENNGFDKNTGSTFGFELKYDTHLKDKLYGGVEYYGVTDTGLTNEDKNIAYGQFMSKNKNSNQKFGGAFGAHLAYIKDDFKATIARSQFDSPLTKMQITHAPNLFEYARIDAKISDFDLSFAYITQIAYGSRSAADFGLIGEKTGTAGMVVNPFKDIERGKYYRISDVVGNNNVDGVAVIGAKKTFDKFRMEAWDFHVNDTLNNIYIEMEYPFYEKKGYAAGLHTQYLNQSIDDRYDEKYGGSLYGLKLSTKIKKLKVNFSYNHKDDEGGFLNPSGANPGYTSSIFSRNEYRSGVDAIKISAMYPLAKKLKVIATYADYGKSNMTLNRGKDKPALAAQTDAKETNIVLVYKPMKNLTLKLFNAHRISEFDTTAKEKTQNHTRLIANYAF